MARLTLQETIDRIFLLIRAGYPVLYIVSHEEGRVLDFLAKIVRMLRKANPGKQLLRWQQGVGIQQLDGLTPYDGDKGCWLELPGIPGDSRWVTRGAAEPEPTIENIKAAGVTAVNPVVEDSITVFFDVHRYLKQDLMATLVRPVRNAADAFRRYYEDKRLQHRVPDQRYPYKTMVIVAPSDASLSLELERDLIVLDFPLPEKDELLLSLNALIDSRVLSFPEEIPREDKRALFENERELDTVSDEDCRARLCDLIAGAGRGLTLDDYKLGLNQMAVEGRALRPDQVERMLNLKAKAINDPALEYTPNVDVTLGGLHEVKQWINVRRGAVVSDSIRSAYRLPAPKGVLLCGAAGGGKSRLAQLIATQFSLALLRLDVGALFGMYVGQSEEKTRRALQLAEVLAPVVLWIDELDKAFMGVGSSGGDGGTSARVLGHFLTWLAEKEDSVFVVATANKYEQLFNEFPEFGRKGRFDEIFWVGLPDREARKEIFDIYLRPLAVAEYLKFKDEQGHDLVGPLASDRNVPLPPEPEGLAKGGDVSEDTGLRGVDARALNDFCRLLSQDSISGNMTGAEIEYAIIEAKYLAYRIDQQRGQGSGPAFSPHLILTTVERAQGRALYQAGAHGEGDELLGRERTAREKGWIGAGGDHPGDPMGVLPEPRTTVP